MMEGIKNEFDEILKKYNKSDIVVKEVSFLNKIKNENLTASCLACRRTESALRDLNHTYSYQNKPETYSQMIDFCYGIKVEEFGFSDSQHFLCEHCIAQLRVAVSFRKLIEVARNNFASLDVKFNINITNFSKFDDDFSNDMDYDDAGIPNDVKQEPDVKNGILPIDFDDLMASKQKNLTLNSAIKMEKSGKHKKKTKKVSSKSCSLGEWKTAKEREDGEDGDLIVPPSILKFLSANAPVKKRHAKKKKKEKLLDEKVEIKKELNEDVCLDDEALFKQLKLNIRKKEKVGGETEADFNSGDDDIYASDNFPDEEFPELIVPPEIQKILAQGTVNRRVRRDKMYGSLRRRKTIAEVGLDGITGLRIKKVKRHGLPYKVNVNDRECRLCHKTFDKFTELRRHMPSHYPNLTCECCGRLFVTKRQLDTHTRSHKLKQARAEAKQRSADKAEKKTENLPYKLEYTDLQCKICMTTFPAFKELQRHMPTHFPNHTCEVCGRVFATLRQLMGHSRVHDAAQHACKICSKTYKDIGNYRLHMLKHEGKADIYRCDQCPKRFTSRFLRMGHMQKYHGLEKRRHVCGICGAVLMHASGLIVHMRRSHANVRRHSCSVCGMPFSEKYDLQRHMLKHTGEKKIHCKICDKWFTRQSALNLHIRIHNGDKRYVCNICGRAFTQKGTLKGHLNVHAKEGKVRGKNNCLDAWAV